MDLIDVPVGTEIGIDVTYKGTSLRKVTTIVCNKNNILLCEPILDYDNQQLDFGLGQFRCTVRVALAGKEAMVFNGVIIRTCIWQGEEYIVLSNARLSPKTNRREAYRQYLGLSGGIKTSDSDEEVAVNIRDISVTGVAFVYNGKEEHLCDIQQEVTLHFRDDSINKDISLSIKVVRESPYDEDKKLYGSQIITTNCNLGNYVAIKQAQELSRI